MLNFFYRHNVSWHPSAPLHDEDGRVVVDLVAKVEAVPHGDHVAGGGAAVLLLGRVIGRTGVEFLT